MKKILIPVAILALSISISASALTAPRGTSTTRVEDNRNIQKKKNDDSLNRNEIKKADATCALNALSKRDASVTAALQKYTSSWIETINTRRAAQVIAFSKEGSERVKLLRTSREVARKTQDAVQKELKRTKVAAGDIYRAEMRLCGYQIDSSDE